MGAEGAVTFGFTEVAGINAERVGDSGPATPRVPRSPDAEKIRAATRERNVGLGTGAGGQIARSFLSEKGGLIVESLPNTRGHGGQQGSRGWRLSLMQTRPHTEPTRPELPGGASNSMPQSLSEGPEPPGMFLALLLNDMQPPSEQDLQPIREHRWTFHGAVPFAMQGRGFCYFIRCLLDLQRNVQLEEEGDALDQKLASACKTFVTAQCRQGNMGGMYQMLSHFISNSAIFSEWDQFLRVAFEDPRATQETFLVPHLEQVWSRFCRFMGVLEIVFDVLNSRFVWRHRLPKVNELILDHMKRRCFSHESVVRNELFSQAANRNETIKQVKYAVGLT